LRRRRPVDLQKFRAEKPMLLVKLPQPRDAFQERREILHELGCWRSWKRTYELMKFRHHPKSWLRIWFRQRYINGRLHRPIISAMIGIFE
jgi:hypothetical protein